MNDTRTYCPDCGEPVYCDECWACPTCATDCICGAHDDHNTLAYEGGE